MTAFWKMSFWNLLPDTLIRHVNSTFTFFCFLSLGETISLPLGVV
uniref:Uncharacterized protein n=1 Tax=Anguilla anguilla TaxID=7936 RepID=A0A0E9RBY0_ANGAN